ncbi:hypothetical protein K435DRAFT_817205 [Dendrothele bispora CBS 962.96]|uniref:Uncharacterized protein n=1 Tax=Dendrothele bispora (strain CBS 962.96) TaxID=1314807 RepID=A0A4S8ML53_DENBC|nr:hypothetical protein K435DRAFT_817205 [Dendrothele bispora CBS 962.96]
MATHPSLPNDPSWPSLYNPRSELFHIEHTGPVQPGATYLTDAGDVFRFTLYWTLVLYLPIFAVFGLYAFFNLTFPPSRKKSTVSYKTHYGEDPPDRQDTYPLYDIPHRTSNHFLSVANIGNGYQTLRSDIVSSNGDLPQSPMRTHFTHDHRAPERQNAGRSRLTFALLVFLVFLFMSLIGAVLSSAIVGFVVHGLYRAGHFYMSSWVPFLWALIQVFIGMLNVWPSVIDFI